MKNIKISDITLRESEQASSTKMSFKEKLETAKLLEKLRVDIIETGEADISAAETAFIRALATTLEYSILSVPVSIDKAGIDSAWAALSKAKKPRLNLIVPTSTVGMEYRHQIKASKMLQIAGEMVSYCKSLCPDVEFTADDAIRSEPDFLAAIIKTAIGAGAGTITICDSVGELTPEELSDFISSVYTAVPEIHNTIDDKKIVLALLCKDSLGLASAAVLSGINAGVGMVKVSSCAGPGTLSLEQFINILKVRGDTLGISTDLSTTALQRTCSRIAVLTGTSTGSRRQDTSVVDNIARDTGLSAETDINEFRNHITSIGYDVTEEDLGRIYNQFKEIARSKKVVSRDIDALVAETSGQAPPVYQLKNYVINSGNTIIATAYIELIKNGIVSTALSAGDGPIDAAFKAAEQIFGVHYELEEFQINAVTGGREATGDALVKIRYNGKLISGRGVSTDIVGASIRAYLSAVNKIVHENGH